MDAYPALLTATSGLRSSGSNRRRRSTGRSECQLDARVEQRDQDVGHGAQQHNEERAEHDDHQHGGTSSWPIDCAAYWPTPCRLNTDSVRIAPPPTTAAKSSPKGDDRYQRVAEVRGLPRKEEDRGWNGGQRQP